MDFTSFSRREDAATVGSAHRSKAYIVFWFLFQIGGGQVLMPVLIATFLFSRAQRHITLVNFCACFVLTGLFSSLLLYAGQLTGPEPDLTLCIFQAAASDSLPPLWATALLMFVLHIRHAITNLENKEAKSGEEDRTRTYIAVVIPYVVFFVFLTTGCILASLHPDGVTRADRVLYCDITNSDAYDAASASFSAIVALVSLILTVPIVRHLLRVYPWFRKMSNATASHQLGIRLCVFLVFVTIGIVFGVWSNFNDVNASVRDMYISSVPVAIFAVFGSQNDVVAVWCFWRRLKYKSGSGDSEATSRSTIIIDNTSSPQKSRFSL